MNLRDNRVTREMLDEPEWTVISSIGLFFLGMIIAAILDINTAMPAGAWLAIWFGLTSLPGLLYGFAMTHPVNRYNGAVRDYYRLSKDQRKIIPKKAIEAIKREDDHNDDYLRLYSEVSYLIQEVKENDKAKSHESHDALIEQVGDIRQSLKVETDTFKELGNGYR